jgi:hypothetical protein
MALDSTEDLFLVKVRIPGLKTPAANPQLIENLGPGLAGKVTFEFIKQVNDGGGGAILLFLCHVENFPPKFTQVRTISLAMVNEKSAGRPTMLVVTITNLPEPQQLDVLGPAIPWVLSDDGGITSFDLTTGDAPASHVSVSAMLTEQDGSHSLDGSLWNVCEGDCSNSCPTTQTKDVNVPQRTRVKLWLCAPKPSEFGQFTGTVLVSAREYPSGHSINSFRLYATSSSRKVEGVGLLCLSVILAWLARSYLANRQTRDQALLGVAIQRQRAEKLASTVNKLRVDFSVEVSDVYSYLNDLLVTKLSIPYIDAQLYTTPSIPVPFQFTPRASQFAAFLNQVDAALNLLTIVVGEGFQPVLALWQVTRPDKKAAFQIAVGGMDSTYLQSPDLTTASIQVRTALDQLRKAVGGAVAVAAAAAPPPKAPSVDSLLIDIRRISQITWVLICLLTVIAGWVVLIGKNPGFGKPTDLLFCVLWGFGVPVTVQSLTPSSVLTAFTGSTMRVSAVAA